MTRGRTPAGLLLAGLLALILLTGCGGSSEVKPAAYVKSMCGALGNWRNTIQSAGVALQSSGASTAPRAVARLDYQRFVHSLVDATRHATEALRVAGTPAVAHGEQIAKRLTRAFDRATEGLVRASSQAKGLRIDTASDFALGVGAVAGAFLLSRLRARFGQNVLLTVAAVGFAAATAVLALVHSFGIVLAALVVGGASWLL